jgi:hypothetical protein
MSSLLKHTYREDAAPRDTYLVAFKTQLRKLEAMEDVELLMQKLQFLGLNFDPFQEDVGAECGQVLDQLGLRDLVRNPYEATNVLLWLLDRTEERLKTLKQ